MYVLRASDEAPAEERLPTACVAGERNERMNAERKTVVVSGSSGLIGSALVTRLAAAGHHVMRLVRRPALAGEIRWDPSAGELPAADLDGVDAVIHLAGAGIGDKRWTAARKAEIFESRTTSTDLLARTLANLERPPSVLLSGSAVGIYGARGDEQLDESATTGNRLPRRPLPGVGGGDRTSVGSGHRRRPSAQRDRAQFRRRGVGQATPALQVRARWAVRLGPTSGRAGSASTTRSGRSSTSSRPGSSVRSTSPRRRR